MKPKAILAMIIFMVLGMLQGYPFWADAGAPTTPTIFDPILRAAVTTITFRGRSRGVKVMGISVSGDTPTFGNNIRLKVGNSAPDYRYYELPSNAFDHDGLSPATAMVNYWDLGGIEVQEGETITLSCGGIGTGAGTGAFSGVLWVEDGEPNTGIPNGDVVEIRCGADNDAGTALSVTGFDIDGRKLENNRLYTPFMAEVSPEDDSVEIIIMAADKDAMTLPPVGRMVYPAAPLQFTGMQFNNGGVAGYVQVAAATKVDIRIWCIESAIPNLPSSPSAPALTQVSSYVIPGAISVRPIVQGGGGTKQAMSSRAPARNQFAAR